MAFIRHLPRPCIQSLPTRHCGPAPGATDVAGVLLHPLRIPGDHDTPIRIGVSWSHAVRSHDGEVPIQRKGIGARARTCEALDVETPTTRPARPEDADRLYEIHRA